MTKAQLTDFCIQTGEGFFDYEDPNRSTVTIEEIAHSLNGMRRWNGQTTRYISVAQHVLLVADYLYDKYGPLYAYYGLHHDDHEALRGDIPSPRKRYLRAHKQLFEGEEISEDTFIYGKLLNVPYPVPEIVFDRVKEADLVSLITEKQWLKPDTVVWPQQSRLNGLEPLPEDKLYHYLELGDDAEVYYLAEHWNLRKELKL